MQNIQMRHISIYLLSSQKLNKSIEIYVAIIKYSNFAILSNMLMELYNIYLLSSSKTEHD